KLTLIYRMGAVAIKSALPPILEAVKKEGIIATHSSDPMHGNTYTDEESGLKTRNFDKIKSELTSAFEISYATGTWLGGMHVELNGDNVTECLGGSLPNNVTDLSEFYDSACDPR